MVMIPLTHFLLTYVLARFLDLSYFNIILAMIFGVFLDLDHLFKLPAYLKNGTLKSEFVKVIPFFRSEIKQDGIWTTYSDNLGRDFRLLRTPLQEPIGFLWVIPIAVYLNNIIPILFFSLHLTLDYLTEYEKLPFYPISDFSTKFGIFGSGELPEWIFIAILAIVALLVS